MLLIGLWNGSLCYTDKTVSKDCERVPVSDRTSWVIILENPENSWLAKKNSNAQGDD